MRVARVFSWKSALVVLSLGVFGLALIGCSTDAPLAPSNKVQPLKVVADADRQVYELMLDKQNNSVTIGQDGGVVYIEYGKASSRLVVPPGALDAPVAISCEATTAKLRGRKVWMYDFKPDGLQFNRPAKLYKSTDFPRGTTLKLYWLNPQTRKWHLEQAANTDENGVVVFNIHHFSKYAIS